MPTLTQLLRHIAALDADLRNAPSPQALAGAVFERCARILDDAPVDTEAVVCAELDHLMRRHGLRPRRVCA